MAFVAGIPRRTDASEDIRHYSFVLRGSESIGAVVKVVTSLEPRSDAFLSLRTNDDDKNVLPCK